MGSLTKTTKEGGSELQSSRNLGIYFHHLSHHQMSIRGYSFRSRWTAIGCQFLLPGLRSSICSKRRSDGCPPLTAYKLVIVRTCEYHVTSTTIPSEVCGIGCRIIGLFSSRKVLICDTSRNRLWWIWTLTGSSNRIAFLKVRGSSTVPFLTPPLDLCLSGTWQGLYLRFEKTHATMRLDYVLEYTYHHWCNSQHDRRGLCDRWREREYSRLPSHSLCILSLNRNPKFRSQHVTKTFIWATYCRFFDYSRQKWFYLKRTHPLIVHFKSVEEFT